MRKKILQFAILFMNFSILYGQSNSDSLYINIEYADSPDLLDFYRFEGIDYNKIKISGINVNDKYYLLTSSDYSNGVLTKVDPLCYLKQFGMKNNSDTIEINVMSKKTVPDTVKFQFNNMSRFVSRREYKTTKGRYSLRVIEGTSFHKKETINLLAYSLPSTKHNNRLGGQSYCALTDDGVFPEEWWDKYGVEHYIVFKFKLIE